MLREYRYQGVTSTGKAVQGIFHAKNTAKAKAYVKEIKEKHKLTIKSLLPKRTFLYTVKLPSGKKINGRQLAYTKTEVASALSKIGYKNTSIQPLLLDFKFKPPFASILMFVNLSSFMLKEKMQK